MSLLLMSAQSVGAQVSISFDDYHGYDGTVDYIRRVAREHRNITELMEMVFRSCSPVSFPMMASVIPSQKYSWFLSGLKSLKCMLKESVNEHWVFRAHLNSFLGIFTQHCFVINNFHTTAAKHKRWTYHKRVPDSFCDGKSFLQ